MNKEKLIAQGINYDDAVRRFVNNDKLYEKLLIEFVTENDFNRAGEAIKAENYEEAYNCLHTMKGVTGNLSINTLYNDCCLLVDELKKKDYSKISEDFDSLMLQYERTCEVIRDASNTTDSGR